MGKVISVSTDKAVKPVNVLGMSNAIQERIMLNQAHEQHEDTDFVCVRYGTVLGSRGSVVPVFRAIIRDGQPLRLTHPAMTCFMLTFQEAVQLVFQATVTGKSGEL